MVTFRRHYRSNIHVFHPILIVLVAFSALALISTQPVHAAGIVVNSPLDTSATDGDCTLREAIDNANTDSDTTGGDCAAGVAGADTITFNLGGTILLGATLPIITTPITVDGSGQTIAISGNDAFGVFYVDTAGDLTLDTLSIQNGNLGVLSTNQGNAVFNNAGTVTASHVTFANNQGANGGAVYSDTGSTLTSISDSTFTNNSATGNGGAIYATGATITLTNSTFSANSAATNGGAIFEDAATLTMTSNTLANNSAGGNGGAIFQGSTIGGSVFFAGNILDTGTGTGANCDGTVAFTDNGYNISSDPSCAFDFHTGSRNDAPLNLVALATNDGGSTQTHTPGSGSAAIATIPNGTTINNNGVLVLCNATTTDQNGINHPRIANGACSSGAVEAATGVISCPTPNNITTAAALNACLIAANVNPSLDTLTLSANINLTTELPYIAGSVTLHGGGFFVDGGNDVRVLRVTDSGIVNLDNITIQHGLATEGGGISNSGTLAISNSTIDANSAIAVNAGGGINNLGTLTVTNTTISNNTAPTPLSNGGGIYSQGPLTITDSTVSGNTSEGNGGGVYGTSGAITVTGSTFSTNSTTTNGGDTFGTGGGLVAEATAPVTIDTSTFDSNVATYGGGILNYATATVSNSTFSNNTAATAGGGIHNGPTGILTVTNSTVSNNTSANGGGLFNQNQLTLTQTTISGNTASGFGGGILAFTGDINLAGDILDAGSGGNCVTAPGGFIVDNGYNLSSDGSCGFAATGSANGATLLLGPLQNNGGPTLTQLPDASSAAIDAIPNGTVITNVGTTYTCNQNAEALDTDQRGLPRPSVPTGGCDVGAVDQTSSSFGTIKPVLLTPTNGSSQTTNPPTLTWNPVVDATDYNVRYGTTNPPTTVVANVGATNYTFPSALALGTYFWQVQAINAANQTSDWSDPFSFTLLFDISAQKPVLVTPANGSSTTTNPPHLVWNAVPTATHYNIRMDTNSSPTTVIATVNTTSYTFPSALAADTYFWQVQAVNAANQTSDWSDPFSFTLLSATNAVPPRNYFTTDTPTLTWAAVSNATGYDIEIDRTPNFNSSFDFTLTAPVGTLFVTTPQLADGTYYWRVRAQQGSARPGSWSAMQTFLVHAT